MREPFIPLLLAAAGLFALAPEPSAQSISVSTRNREIPEAGYLAEMVVCAEQVEFCFVPPAQWKRAESEGAHWGWSSRDMGALLSLNVRINPSQQATLPEPAVLRQELALRYPEARVVEEFACYTAGDKGLAVDLEESTSENLKRVIRIAHVPFQGGVAEFALVTSKTALPKQRHALTSLMNSFRVTALTPDHARSNSVAAAQPADSVTCCRRD